jgi:hypothetical protein
VYLKIAEKIQNMLLEIKLLALGEFLQQEDSRWAKCALGELQDQTYSRWAIFH